MDEKSEAEKYPYMKRVIELIRGIDLRGLAEPQEVLLLARIEDVLKERDERIEKLVGALKELLTAVTFAHIKEFGKDNPCWEARVPVAFVDIAKQALAEIEHE